MATLKYTENASEISDTAREGFIRYQLFASLKTALNNSKTVDLIHNVLRLQ